MDPYCNSHAHLHSIGEHLGESEGDLHWELLPRHGNLKRVPKVDVEDVAHETIQHQVGGMPV